VNFPLLQPVVSQATHTVISQMRPSRKVRNVGRAKETIMTIYSFRTTALILAAAIVMGCNSESSDTNQRVAELEKKLADTQRQLAETAQ